MLHPAPQRSHEARGKASGEGRQIPGRDGCSTEARWCEAGEQAEPGRQDQQFAEGEQGETARGKVQICAIGMQLTRRT